jgi:hypothetical protein
VVRWSAAVAGFGGGGVAAMFGWCSCHHGAGRAVVSKLVSSAWCGAASFGSSGWPSSALVAAVVGGGCGCRRRSGSFGTFAFWVSSLPIWAEVLLAPLVRSMRRCVTFGVFGFRKCTGLETGVDIGANYLPQKKGRGVTVGTSQQFSRRSKI